jgi:hypothetical protein
MSTESTEALPDMIVRPGQIDMGTCWLRPSEYCLFCSFLVCDRSLVLHSRGRPTSVVLLLLMVVAKFSLPLSSHSPLCLHHLLRLVGSARRLVSLRSIEVLQAGASVTTDARITELGYRVRSRAWSRGSSAVCISR